MHRNGLETFCDSGRGLLVAWSRDVLSNVSEGVALLGVGVAAAGGRSQRFGDSHGCLGIQMDR